MTEYYLRRIIDECNKLRDKIDNDDAFQHINEIEAIIENIINETKKDNNKRRN